MAHAKYNNGAMKNIYRNKMGLCLSLKLYIIKMIHNISFSFLYGYKYSKLFSKKKAFHCF